MTNEASLTRRVALAAGLLIAFECSCSGDKKQTTTRPVDSVKSVNNPAQVKVRVPEIGVLYRAHDRVYGEFRQRSTIEIRSANELEFTGWGGDHFIYEYTIEKDRLRVVFEEMGSKQAKYYGISLFGLFDEKGTYFFTPEEYNRREAIISAINTPASPNASQSTGKPNSIGKSDGTSIIDVRAMTRHFNAKDATFVDARDYAAYEKQHIEGAAIVPPEALFDGVETFDRFRKNRQDTIIVYCNEGPNGPSSRVAAILRQIGYPNVKICAEKWDVFSKLPDSGLKFGEISF